PEPLSTTRICVTPSAARRRCRHSSMVDALSCVTTTAAIASLISVPRAARGRAEPGWTGKQLALRRQAVQPRAFRAQAFARLAQRVVHDEAGQARVPVRPARGQ